MRLATGVSSAAPFMKMHLPPMLHWIPHLNVQVTHKTYGLKLNRCHPGLPLDKSLCSYTTHRWDSLLSWPEVEE